MDDDIYLSLKKKSNTKSRPLGSISGGACETQIEPPEPEKMLPIADVMEKLRRFKQLLSDIACGRHEDMIKYKGGAINYEL